MSIAIGMKAHAGNGNWGNMIAIGYGSYAKSGNSITLGKYSYSDGWNAIAICTLSSATGNGALAIGGYGAHADGDHASALGGIFVRAYGSDATAVGANTGAYGAHAVALGSGTYTLVDGVGYVTTGTKANGAYATAVGAYAVANGDHATAVGMNAEADGDTATALGNSAYARATNAVALGSNATANNAGDVALGAGSTTAAAVATTGVTLLGNGYSFAGTAPASTVSVGSAGHERTITNVAAGRISATSTDAVNGSQLYATNQALGAVGQQLDGIGARLDRLANRSAAATAAALATAGLIQPIHAGKTAISGSVGLWDGRTGFAVGLAHRMDNDRWSLRGSATLDHYGTAGGNIAVGYEF